LKPKRIEIRKKKELLSIFLTLGFDGKFPLGESSLARQLLGGLERSLMLAQLPSNGSGLTVSQILWLVLLAFVEFSQVLFLSLVNDGKNARDRFSDHSAFNLFIKHLI